MRYCIIDLECTCWSSDDPGKQFHETIEIGGVLLDENYEYISEFNHFVKPQYNPTLTEYCKDLTSIQQGDIDRALKFPTIVTLLKEWLGNTDDVIFCSWGYFDKKQLLEDCKRNMTDYPFNDDHINVKARFSKVMKRTKKMGLQKALRILGIQFEGTPHRGGDDAKMIAKVFKFIMVKEAYDKEHNRNK